MKVLRSIITIHFSFYLIILGIPLLGSEKWGQREKERQRPTDFLWLHHHISSSASKPAWITKG